MLTTPQRTESYEFQVVNKENYLTTGNLVCLFLFFIVLLRVKIKHSKVAGVNSLVLGKRKEWSQHKTEAVSCDSVLLTESPPLYRGLLIEGLPTRLASYYIVSLDTIIIQVTTLAVITVVRWMTVSDYFKRYSVIVINCMI